MVMAPSLQPKAGVDAVNRIATSIVNLAHASLKVVDVHRFGEISLVKLLLRL
jgi:hypothetical protein